MAKDVDPFNYFQVLDHQRESHQGQPEDRPTGVATPAQPADDAGRSSSVRRSANAAGATVPGASSYCGTTKTISTCDVTCDESKQVEHTAVQAAGGPPSLERLEGVMSN